MFFKFHSIFSHEKKFQNKKARKQVPVGTTTRPGSRLKVAEEEEEEEDEKEEEEEDGEEVVVVNSIDGHIRLGDVLSIDF